MHTYIQTNIHTSMGALDLRLCPSLTCFLGAPLPRSCPSFVRAGSTWPATLGVLVLVLGHAHMAHVTPSPRFCAALKSGSWLVLHGLHGILGKRQKGLFQNRVCQPSGCQDVDEEDWEAHADGGAPPTTEFSQAPLTSLFLGGGMGWLPSPASDCYILHPRVTAGWSQADPPCGVPWPEA